MALTQHDLARLKPIEKLRRDYLQDIQTEMSSWKEGGSGTPEDKAQDSLLGVGSYPLYNFIITLQVNSESLCLFFIPFSPCISGIPDVGTCNLSGNCGSKAAP